MGLYAHEGLPRSGKSYEAAVFVILTALKQGRKVWAYVEGLNHEMFAEFSGLTIDQCKEQLIQLTYDEVKNIPARSRDEEWKDGWIIIDEIQNFYPVSTRTLDETTTNFITQHGHNGLDILIMGQSMADVHNLWRNRIKQKTQFLKLEHQGKETSYRWTTYAGVQDGNGKIKFNKINSNVREYDKKYFGLYKSHNPGTQNTENHLDARANIYNTSFFKVAVPVFAVVFFFSVYYIYSFFADEKMINKEAMQELTSKPNQNIEDEFQQQKNIALKTSVVSEQSVIQEPTAQVIEIEQEPEPIDYLDDISNRFKPRLVAMIESENKAIGIIEFLDGSLRVKEKLNFTQVKDMGWDIEIRVNYVYLKKEEVTHVVTSWPIEPSGKVSEYRNNAVRGGGVQVASNHAVTQSPRQTKSHMLKNQSHYKGIYRSAD